MPSPFSMFATVRSDTPAFAAKKPRVQPLASRMRSIFVMGSAYQRSRSECKPFPKFPKDSLDEALGRDLSFRS